MTVSTNVNTVSYAGDDVTTVFDLGAGFIFFEQEELEVTLSDDNTGDSTVLTLGTDYSVSGGGGETGTVTTVTAPATDETLTIRRVMPLTQLSNLVNNDTQDAEVVEDMVDRNTLGLQQMDEELTRAITIPVQDTADTVLPSSVNRRNKYLFFEDTDDASPVAVSNLDENVVPLNAVLEAMRQTPETPADNRICYLTGLNDSALTDFTAVGRAVVGGATEVASRDGNNAHRLGANDGLTMYVNGAGWTDLIRGGWVPAFFNQEWGGARWGNLPDGSLGEAATGYLAWGDNERSVAELAANTYVAQGFKVSENTTVSALWLSIAKANNPTNNLQVEIWDDSSGSPNAVITNGTATAQSGRTHSTDSKWRRFVFPTPPALTANTQYHIVINSSGAVDAVNYWRLSWFNSSKKYPHGNVNVGNATPTWTPSPGAALGFLVEDSNNMISGAGDKLVFNEGTPLDQSKGIVKPLRDFFDEGIGTFLVRGANFTKDKTILDAQWGIDHDRIVVRCDVTTGFPVVILYETDGGVQSIVGTTDISDGSSYDIGVRFRAANDGSDYLTLYLNGTSQGTPVTGASISLDPNFVNQGHVTLGGGFTKAPTWTESENMNALPSAGNWTFVGTATEANVFEVLNGNLYQVLAGYGSTDTGYYSSGTIALSNTNGWTTAIKLQVNQTNANLLQSECVLSVEDGTKRVQLFMHENWIEVWTPTAGSLGIIEVDMGNTQRVVAVSGKGSDVFVYIDGKLEFDGTGLLTGASANNQMFFGDTEATSGANAGAIWDYVKYYTAAWIPPEFTGASVTEAAYWQDDKSGLLDEISGKTLKAVTGVRDDYIERVNPKYDIYGKTSGPTTTSTSTELLPDMNLYVLATQDIETTTTGTYRNATAGTTVSNSTHVDGLSRLFLEENFITSSAVNEPSSLTTERHEKLTPGMHYVDLRWRVSAGTGEAYLRTRKMTARTR